MNSTQQVTFEDFDETQYLRLNPDVLNAVQQEDFKSGWEHYLMFGINENRHGVAKQYEIVEQLSGNVASIPIPPPDLRARVHGREELSEFHKIGKLVSQNLESTIQSIPIELDDHSYILDFGCGCGRIISWFHNLYQNSKFYGTDIDDEAVTWCQENLSDQGNFSVNEAMPPLPYSDQFFDLVYSISIFTHLPEEMQFAWLKELKRVCKKGAYLLLTVHGEHLFPLSSGLAKTEFENNGFYYSVGDGTMGLPEFYQTSFHTETYIRSSWSNFFEIENIVPKGIANHQDLIICKNIL
ncbi:MAG: class I SAM-dependent methyltransferase [Waterburya sp.]